VALGVAGVVRTGQLQTERLDDGAEAFILTVRRFLRKHSTKYYIVL